jgi:putative photosynthetic complex assembly protein
VREVSGSGEERFVHEVPSGEGGFIRGVLRSLARARNAQGIGSDHPFVLKQQATGTLLLEDPETGQRIDLQAFGPTNIGSFRTILEHAAAGP